MSLKSLSKRLRKLEDTMAEELDTRRRTIKLTMPEHIFQEIRTFICAEEDREMTEREICAELVHFPDQEKDWRQYIMVTTMRGN